MKRPAFRTAASIIVVLLLSLSAGELTVRIVHFFHPLFIFYDDSYNRFRGRPFSSDFDFKLNSQGFKDTEFSGKKKGIFRIAAIGDSFAFGIVPYRYNYLTLLESRLQDQGFDAEVCNMGIPSTGPGDYLSILGQEALQLQPDMVLLSFFIGNDMTEGVRGKKWYEYSYVASLFRYLVVIRNKYEGRVVHNAATYCDSCPTFDEPAYLDVEKERSAVYLTEQVDVLPQIDQVLAPVEEMRNICKEQGIPFAVVIIPDEVQVNKELQQKVRAALAVQDSGWNTTLPNEQLAAELQNKGIAFLDLLPFFAEKAKTERLYRLRDSHWNIAGNQLAADIIQEYISNTVQIRQTEVQP